MASRSDLYISADVEADGPIPGVYSMLSFGLAVAGTFDGEHFEARDPLQDTFYVELRPITGWYEAGYVAASRLDRDRLLLEGADPIDAMTAAADWVDRRTEGCRPVLVAWPLAFDWPFLNFYFERFSALPAPFGFDSCLDMKTMYQQKAGVVLDLVAKRHMPEAVRPARHHSHHALSDAIEQAEMFAKLFTWAGGASSRQGPPAAA